MDIFKELKSKIPETVTRPFWSWNDKLEPDELVCQMQAMKDVGIGGFFMHARSGLVTEYLSDDWFKMIETCLDFAEQNDMQAWAYDENGWPSGATSGIVPAKDFEYQQKSLKYGSFTAALLKEPPKNILVLFKPGLNGYEILDKPVLGACYVAYDVNPYYIDTFNFDAVKYFIETTHEVYYKRFGDRFGKALKGFFTDEPQYGHPYAITWSNTFPAAFKERYGIDLITNLPKLFVAYDGYQKFRYDYFSMVAELFRESFMKQIYDWCNAHNCALTGHMMAEYGLLSQIGCTGGVMPCYEYFNMPGIDWLTRNITDPITAKQLGSVATQLGRPTLTESFACCGWDVSLEELKRIYQWQLVNGVDSLCQHLEGYTLKGLRKRDYPATLFTQWNPFFNGYDYFNKYFTKLAALLRCGKEDTEVLLIHPLFNAYLIGNGTDSNRHQLTSLDMRFKKLTDLFNGSHIPHHYGDETIMKKYGKVDGATIIIGNCRYTSVVLPAMYTLSRPVAKMLIEFAKNGGKIYATDNIPELIDGAPDTLCDELAKYLISIETDELAKTLRRNISVAENGKECESIHVRISDLEDGTKIYYLVNMSPDKVNVDFSLPGDFSADIVDVVGETETPLNVKNGKIALSFAEGEAKVLHVFAAAAIPAAEDKNIEYLQLGNTFKIEGKPKNALTIDYCRYRIDGGDWNAEIPLILLQQKLLELCRTCDIDLEYSFTVDDVSACGDLELVMETPEKYKIVINGKDFTFNDKGYYLDKTFRRSDISSYVIKGKNKIVVSGEFRQSDYVYKVISTPNIHESVTNRMTYDTELESIYLLGNFGIKEHFDYTLGEKKCIHGGREFSICKITDAVDCRDITQQGFWFYSGNLALSQKITIDKKQDTTYLIALDELRSPTAYVSVNGKFAGRFIFTPFALDVTDFLNDGENTVTITLCSGNRNLLGPHHQGMGECYAVSPRSFEKIEGSKIPQHAWTDNYNFVRFGFEIKK